MKIIALQAENVKRLKAVDITPDGPMVVIGGQNAAGKSSLLDSIAYALGGKGHVTIRLDGDHPLKIKRTFNDTGTTSLKVTTADGATPASPQTLLDGLCGRIAFDPLEFTRLSPQKQAETLRGLVGLDFAEHDAKRRGLFDERTGVNRDVKHTEARLDAAPQHGGIPDAEVSVADLTTLLTEAQALNTAKTQAEHKANDAESGVVLATLSVKRTEEALAEAQRIFDGEVARKTKLREEAARLTAEAEKLPACECQPLLDRMAAADTTNTQVRENRERKRLAAELAGLYEKTEALTEAIKQLDTDKQDTLEATKWPVEGLGFAESGITFSGLPLEQASSAEELRISVAIGLALNPTLRVLLIRDGSLLDDNNLAMLAQMAAAADAQVWLERVGEGPECAVIIEDGHVKQEEAEAGNGD